MEIYKLQIVAFDKNTNFEVGKYYLSEKVAGIVHHRNGSIEWYNVFLESGSKIVVNKCDLAFFK